MRTSTFYPLIPILLQCASLQLLWPLQIPKNFKFKPIFLVFLPPQDEFSSSSSSPHAANSCDELSPFVLSNSRCHEDQSKDALKKKQKKLWGTWNFQIPWTTHLPWVEFVVDDKGVSTKWNVRFAPTLLSYRYLASSYPCSRSTSKVHILQVHNFFRTKFGTKPWNYPSFEIGTQT